MFRISNNDFKILIKYKEFLNDLDNILENVPRKDMYFKDKVRDVSMELLYDIFYFSYDSSNLEIYKARIKSNIAMIDFMLERLFDKKYINEKALFKIGKILVEINKMVTGWVNSYESKYD